MKESDNNRLRLDNSELSSCIIKIKNEKKCEIENLESKI